MKVPSILAFCATIAALGLSAAAHADDAKPSKSATVSTRSVPFVNYWDARQWDRSASGAFFWHKRTDDRPRTKIEKQHPRTEKSGRAISPSLSNS